MTDRKSLNSFERLMRDKLDQFIERLSILVELLTHPLNIEGLRLGRLERILLELYNLKHTANGIAKKLGKTSSHVHKTLSGLHDKNLIKSLKIGDKTYYIRTRR